MGLFNSVVAGLLGSALYAAASVCTPTAELVAVHGVAEASGVAMSGRTPFLLWVHNDSGDPVIVAVDGRSGAVKGRVQVTGARVTHWEDIAAGPCPQGSCLYIADIGDNNRRRRAITIYRVPEPRADQPATEPADVWTATYPDGAHDAEALFIAQNALLIVTKEEASSAGLYRMQLPAAGSSRLERVASVPVELVTGASASPDGAWVALRTNDALLFYRSRELTDGGGGRPLRVGLAALGEPQGEGVAIGGGGVVYLVGEGGRRSGTLATLRCTLH